MTEPLTPIDVEYMTPIRLWRVSEQKSAIETIKLLARELMKSDEAMQDDVLRKEGFEVIRNSPEYHPIAKAWLEWASKHKGESV